MNTCYIYGLRAQNSTQFFYVGSTKRDLQWRLAKHKNHCASGLHRNPEFNRVVKEIGIDNLAIELIEEVDQDRRFKREAYWINTLPNLINVVKNPNGGRRNVRLEWRNRIIGYDTKPAGQFTPNPLNWRTHPSVQREALRGLLGDVGWVGAVLENKQTGNLIDGHARVEEALASDRDTPIPYLLVDLTPEEERLVLASFDPISALATADNKRLEELLKDVSSSSSAVDSMLAELAKEHGVLTSDESKDAEPQVDKAAELQQKWGTESGQLWVIGSHSLLIGDCASVVDAGRVLSDGATLCFTSPPYNAGSYELTGNIVMRDKSSRYRNASDNLPEGEYVELLTLFTQIALERCKVVAVNIQQLANNKFAVLRWVGQFWEHFIDRAIWYKGTGNPAMAERVMNSRFEDIWMFSNEKRPSRAIKTAEMFRGTVPNVFECTGASKDNPIAESNAGTMPPALCSWAIESWTKRGDVIYEPFAGSGTTAVSCENLGRHSRMVEIDPCYAAVILERMTTAFPHLKIEKADQARAA